MHTTTSKQRPLLYISSSVCNLSIGSGGTGGAGGAELEAFRPQSDPLRGYGWFHSVSDSAQARPLD